MRRADKHLADNVLLLGGHAAHAHAAAVLRAVLETAILLTYPAFVSVNTQSSTGIKSSSSIPTSPTPISVRRASPYLRLISKKVGLYYLNHAAVMRQNVLQLRNFLLKLGVFAFNLVALQTGKLTQTHIHNRLRLPSSSSKRSISAVFASVIDLLFF